MQRYFAIEKRDNYLVLDKNDLHHIKNVMRMKSDNEIEIVYDEKIYICRVGDVIDNSFLIIDKLNDNNELDIELIVAVALVKEQKMDIILQKLTELGVKKIIPLKMERSIVKLDNKKMGKKLERWRSICKEASEQSKRNIVPIIESVKNIEDLEKVVADYKFVCSVENKSNFISKYLQKKDKCAKMIFVIGPEGGITSNEEKILNDMGYLSVSLGKRVLRVETACIYVASVVGFMNMG